MTEYEISARDYLARMQARLADGDRASLFYAAFELRCGIESRLQQYAEVANDITGKKKIGWRVVKLTADIESVFATGDKVVELAFPGKRLFFTPVRKSLRKTAEQMGNYLHAMKTLRDVHTRAARRSRPGRCGLPFRVGPTRRRRSVRLW
jgi:hypothetical protein